MIDFSLNCISPFFTTVSIFSVAIVKVWNCMFSLRQISLKLLKSVMEHNLNLLRNVLNVEAVSLTCFESFE